MNNNKSGHIAVYLALAFLGLCANSAYAQVACDDVDPTAPPDSCSGEFGGNIYIVVRDDGIDWESASLAAVATTRDGVPGHLATTTSRAEFDFVEGLRATARSKGVLTQDQTWIGGFQRTASEPGRDSDSWEWVNGEGTFPGFDCEPDTGCTDGFADWADGEPNNDRNRESEITLGRFPNDPGFNDEGSAPRSIGGYIVEFDLVVAADSCLESQDGIPEGEIGEGGCDFGFQILELPQELENLLPDNATYSSTAIRSLASARTDACDGEFIGQDPRVDADGNVIAYQHLDLSTVFDLTPIFGSNTAGKVILDKFSVGTPCLGLSRGLAENFSFADFDAVDFDEGPVATLTLFPEQIPGLGPTILSEVGPLNFDSGDADFQPDLQFVPQAVYQTFDRNDIQEREASPFTNEVFNPQRQKTFRFSWSVYGTREFCPIPQHLSPDSNPRGYFKAVYLCKKAFAIDYNVTLGQALVESRSNLENPSLRQLLRLYAGIGGNILIGRYWAAEYRLERLRATIIDAEWNIDDRNDPGNLIMRIENLLFRVQQLEEARANLP